MITTELRTLPKLGADSAGILMTPEEFDAITEYDDCYSYELIHGVLVVNPIPSEQEAEPNELLGYLLLFYKKHHPSGAILDLTLPERYVRTGDSRRKPDRVIWAGLGRRPQSRLDVPTIAVEFVSRGRASWLRDYVAKRKEYLEIGVKEYWIIDRFRRILTVYRDLPGKAGETIVSESDVYQTDLLPGFELPLARLLETADAGQNEGPEP